MTAFDVKLANGLHEQGRFDELLALLRQSFAAVERMPEPAWPDLFMAMLEWKQLAEEHGPARKAMAEARDDQVRRLLAGDPHVGQRDPALTAERMFGRIERFALIVEFNEALGDPRSTRELFVTLDAGDPALARRHAWRALPDIVAVGDFALADRYRGDPLKALGTVNETARSLPMFPPPPGAPRLAAELANLVRDVAIGIAVLRGQGSDAGAAALRDALLAGLESAESKAWAARELDEPGAITRELADWQMAAEGAPSALP